MLTINTNLSSLIAQGSMKSSTNKLNQAIERMTTGFKINHAKDNAANYSIATNMTTKIGAYNVAEDNAAMGLDLISTAEGTLSQIEDKLQRLRALAEQASNGTYGEQSLNAINAEANALVDEINRLYSTAEYNGLKLFGGSTEGGADVVSAALTNDSAPIQTFAVARTSTVTVDESKRVSNVTSFTDGGIYYLTTPEDLVALQELWNNYTGYDGSFDPRTLTFVLVNDIDMSGYEFNSIGTTAGCGLGNFSATFNGAGKKISNLSNPLFDMASEAKIEDLELHVNIVSDLAYDAPLIRCSRGSNFVTNCAVTGSISGARHIGGLISSNGVGVDIYDNIIRCSVDCEISAKNIAAGIYCYATENNAQITIENCAVYGESDLDAVFIYALSSIDLQLEFNAYNVYYDTVGVPLYNDDMVINVLTSDNSAVIPPETNPEVGGGSGSGGGAGGTGGTGTSKPTFTPAPDTIVLQIGAASNWASQVGVSTKFSLLGVDDLRMIGLDLTTDYLTQIDDMLGLVSEKQTHFGAASNRLESVLEEITIQRDNLVSSRSTIRDADIAEVSSHYIQQQILQQASATLLATANQSPAIALQLI